MPKRKSRFIGLILALFTGPLSFLYVRRWRRALLLFPFIWIPFLNAAIYLYTLFAIISNVNRCNRDIYDNVRFGIVVCRCQSQNKSGSIFCSNCGLKLVKTCKECNAVIEKNEKYCNSCGNAFGRIAKRKLALRKLIALA